MRFAKFKNPVFYLLILYFSVFITIEADAQEGFSVGIKAGTGYSQYFFLKRVEQNFVPVFQKGLVISHRDEKNFGVQFEIMQTQKAWEEQISNTFKKKIVINYYEFPILSSYKFGKGKSGLLITAGLHISFATKADSTSTGQQLPSDTTLITYSPLNYSKWDYGLGGGLGYQFVAGRSIFLLEVMYSQGLQNFFKRNYIGIIRSLNQNLYLNLSYKFSLARKKKIKTDIAYQYLQ
jgi:hypothetical protein